MRMIALAAVALALTSATARASGPPNIVLMIADDMAWDDCGAYGHPSVQTPNIDRLAREGMRFDRAFLTCSSCSPSRSSMITARYPHATDAEELHWPLPAEQVTFVEKLKAAGYWTAAAGKWHLGDAVQDRFDEIRGSSDRGFQLPTDSTAANPGQIVIDGPGAAQSGCGEWVPILQDRPMNQPFFLWLAAIDPHRDYQKGTIPEPHQPEDAVIPPYLPDTPEVRADLAMYYDEITRLDSFVGAVLAELECQNVADETLVIFLSDNGRPFPRCKTTVYDSGIKTPLIVRWPGRIAPGSTCASLVSTVDLGPTLLEVAGVDPLPTAQGASFASLFEDPTKTIREHIFAEHNWHDYAAFKRAVRSERHKYIRNEDHELTLSPPADAVRGPTFQTMRRLHENGSLTPEQSTCFLAPRPREELYDVERDPFELRDLTGDPAYAGVLAAMRATLDSWRRETADTPPPALTPDEFDRATGEPLPNRLRPRPSKEERNASR